MTWWILISPIISTDVYFRFAYANFGDESKAECTIDQATSVLLYPTTLQTKFVPAFFTQSNELGQRNGANRYTRQVSSIKNIAVLYIIKIRYGWNEYTKWDNWEKQSILPSMSPAYWIFFCIHPFDMFHRSYLLTYIVAHDNAFLY